MSALVNRSWRIDLNVQTPPPFSCQGSRETPNSTKVAPVSFFGASLQSISRLDPNIFGSSSLSSPSITYPPPTCSLLIGGTVHLRRNGPGDLFSSTDVHQFEVSKGFQLHFISVWAWPSNIIKSNSYFQTSQDPKLWMKKSWFNFLRSLLLGLPSQSFFINSLESLVLVYGHIPTWELLTDGFI